jgi:hypothetical protein
MIVPVPAKARESIALTQTYQWVCASSVSAPMGSRSLPGRTSRSWWSPGVADCLRDPVHGDRKDLPVLPRRSPRGRVERDGFAMPTILI